MLEEHPHITLESLQRGSKWNECSKHLHALSPLWRNPIYNRLAYERLVRKSNEITEIYRATMEDWAQTMHLLLFRFICGMQNKSAAERLARCVPYKVVMRENASLNRLEALLLGASGLLELADDEPYIESLRREFEHLAAKYNITAMSPREWRTKGIYYHNHPILRIAQITACLHFRGIDFSKILACATREDVYNLFAVSASEFWASWLERRAYGDVKVSRRVGHFMSDIIGINVVAPLLYTYGVYIESAEFVDRSMSLLEKIPSENNSYMQAWNSHGTVTTTAYHSQALLQLSREYCSRTRCAECPLANTLLSPQYQALIKNQQ